MKIGLFQMACTPDVKSNVKKAVEYIGRAADAGVKIVCLQELFNTIYFPFEQNPKYFDWAETIPGETTDTISQAAKSNGVAVIAPIFERDSEVVGTYYNSAAVFDTRGRLLGKYRKTSLPQLPHYEEKFYFKPGNLGYPVFDMPDIGTKIGVIICYDRHFLEGPRIEALKGAQIVFVPTCTAFYPELWELELRAHASFNTVFVAGLNRCGTEYPGQSDPFYGQSMLVDPKGAVVSKAGREEELFVADVKLEEVDSRRRMAPFLRDRRPELYEEISQHL
ncbi:MAG: nitrilase-related carbon-nitrogen hydrolase [Thermoprotei archaeon]